MQILQQKIFNFSVILAKCPVDFTIFFECKNFFECNIKKIPLLQKIFIIIIKIQILNFLINKKINTKNKILLIWENLYISELQGWDWWKKSYLENKKIEIQMALEKKSTWEKLN